jgi:hypothetical protein
MAEGKEWGRVRRRKAARPTLMAIKGCGAVV